MSAVHQTFEAVRIALAALKANKARGVLTTLGIIIGIVAVVTTMTAANGLANSFKESASIIGADVLYISHHPWIVTGNFFQFRNRPRLSLKESEKLEERLRSALAVNPDRRNSPQHQVSVRHQRQHQDHRDHSQAYADVERGARGGQVLLGPGRAVQASGLRDRQDHP